MKAACRQQEAIGWFFGRPFVVPGGDLEDEYELAVFDLDFGDVGFDDRFALRGGAVVEDAGEVAAELLDRGLTYLRLGTPTSAYGEDSRAYGDGRGSAVGWTRTH
jgi:hypothetical protein